MIPVRFLDEAEQELISEVLYLDERAEGLGLRFILEAERLRDEIAEYPLSGTVVRSGIRKRSLQKFRYSYFYVIGPGEVVVLAVAHHSRRPGYWLSRRLKVRSR